VSRIDTVCFHTYSISFRSYCCPYGPFLALPVAIITLATICTWIATYECRFFEISNVFESTPDVAITFGLWTVENYYHLDTVEDYDRCVGWAFHRTLDESDLDMPMRIARATGGTACFLSLAILLAVLLLSCVALRDNQLSHLAGCMFFMGTLTIMCQVCMLSNFCRGAGDCKIARSGMLCIAASFLWFLAGCALLSLNKKESECKEQLPLFADDEVDEEEILLATATNDFHRAVRVVQSSPHEDDVCHVLLDVSVVEKADD
jgi:hypothetical protein